MLEEEKEREGWLILMEGRGVHFNWEGWEARPIIPALDPQKSMDTF